MKIYIIRSQQELANIYSTPLGDANSYYLASKRYHNLPLTSRGIEDAHALGRKLYTQIGAEPIILSSPAVRAQQTAEIIAKKLSLPIRIELSLEEINNSEVLHGKKSRVRQSSYQKRLGSESDLDIFLEAEKCDEIQARALYFLERYLGQGSQEIIVSHPGFNRYLVNTSLGRSRSDFVDPSYKTIHSISAVWNNIHYEKLSRARSSETYLVRTKDKSYVLKKIQCTSLDQLRLQREISDFIGDDLISRVLYCDIKEGYAVQILSFFEGEHRYGKINNEDMISAVRKISKRLKNFPYKSNGDFGNMVNSLVDLLCESPLKSYGKMIVEDKNFLRLRDQKVQVLTHYDLHRSNIIFTERGVRFIDLGSFMPAPEQFQPASFFMAGLLLEELEDFNLEKTLSSWGENLSKKDILLLMGVRALMGGAFFQSIIHKTKEETVLYERYLKSMHLIQQLYGAHCNL